MIDRFGEELAVLGDVGGVGHHVDVVEAVIGHVERLEELERYLALHGCRCAVVGAAVPRAIERAAAEHVGAGPAERVPEACGEAEVILHALAEDHLVLVVEPVGQLVGAVGALIFDLGNIGEEVGHRDSYDLGVMRE